MRRSPRRSSTRLGAAAIRCCSSSSRSTRRRCCLSMFFVFVFVSVFVFAFGTRLCAHCFRGVPMFAPFCFPCSQRAGRRVDGRARAGGRGRLFLFVLFFFPCSQRAKRSRRRPGARRGAGAPPLDESTSRREREQRWRSHVGMCVTTIDVFSTARKEDPTAAHQLVLRWSRVRAMAWSHEDVT